MAQGGGSGGDLDRKFDTHESGAASRGSVNPSLALVSGGNRFRPPAFIVTDHWLAHLRLPPPPPLCDIPSGCCSFTGPWTVTRSPLRMLRPVATFCRPLRPVLLLVSFPHSRSPVVGVPGLC